jgi:hypothetical protein
MSTDLIKNLDFKQWLRIRQSQIKVAIKVSSELLPLYWDLGHDIVVHQRESVWGSNFFDQLSKELKTEFPDMKGFSEKNLYSIKQFYLFYNHDSIISHQVGANVKLSNNERIEILPQVREEFEPEYIGKLGYYITAINYQLKKI